MSFGQIAGWIGALTFLGRLIPQSARLLRTRNPAGVSWLASANQVGSSIGWTIYGLGVGQLVLWLPAAVALIPATATLVLVGRPPDRRSWLIAVIWGLAVVLAWPIGGRNLLATFIGIEIVAVVAPQVWQAARSNRLGGISEVTWRVACFDALMWGTYGFAEGEPMTQMYGVVLGAAAVFILVRLRMTRGADATSGGLLVAGEELGPYDDAARVVG